MRLRIDKIWFIVVALVLSVPSAHAQIVTANPLEWMALAEGNEAINGEIEKEIKGQTKTALLQNTIAAEFTKIQLHVVHAPLKHTVLTDELLAPDMVADTPQIDESVE